jgi:hypothetical protein
MVRAWLPLARRFVPAEHMTIQRVNSSATGHKIKIGFGTTAA